MGDEKRLLDENRALWEEWTEIHTKGDFYDVDGFIDGTTGIKIEDWERAEVGDVRGKRLLHLQCHFGLDTLSWARLGAEVTGVDFSPKAIAAARDLAQRTGIEARFIQSSIYELPDVLDEPFDLVYTGRGAIGWLPSIERWAEVACRYVKPGGCLYMHEGHPVLWTFEDGQTVSNPIRLGYPYWEGEVISTRAEGSYADPDAEVQAELQHGWNHGLGEVVTALARRGLRIEFLHEQDFLAWPESFLVEDGNGRYRWPPDQLGTLPLMYSLKASRS